MTISSPISKFIRVKPYGRSGNQIFQAIHAIAYARAHGHRVLIKANPPFLPTLDFDFSDGGELALVELNTFYLGTPAMDHFVMSLDEKALVAREYLAPRLSIKPVVTDAHTLVIHLRSGDIMRPKSAHPHYIPMPLCFLDAVIRDFAFRQIVVVTEPDRSHPCLASLIQRYQPHVIDDLAEGFSTLLGATNMCVSISTFSGAAALCSKQLQVLFCADGGLNPFRLVSSAKQPTFCNIHLYRIRALEQLKWKADASQIRLLTQLGSESCVAVKWKNEPD